MPVAISCLALLLLGASDDGSPAGEDLPRARPCQNPLLPPRLAPRPGPRSLGGCPAPPRGRPRAPRRPWHPPPPPPARPPAPQRVAQRPGEHLVRGPGEGLWDPRAPGHGVQGVHEEMARTSRPGAPPAAPRPSRPLSPAPPPRAWRRRPPAGFHQARRPGAHGDVGPQAHVPVSEIPSTSSSRRRRAARRRLGGRPPCGAPLAVGGGSSATMRASSLPTGLRVRCSPIGGMMPPSAPPRQPPRSPSARSSGNEPYRRLSE